MVGEHGAETVARALAPAGDDDALAGRPQGIDVIAHGLEHVAAGLAAFGGEGAALTPAERKRLRSGQVVRLLEGGELNGAHAVQCGVPLVFVQKQRGRFDGIIGRCAQSLLLARFHAGIVIFLDLLEARTGRIVRQMIEHDGRRAHRVGHGLKAFVEQRQPVFDAGISVAGLDRLIERVLTDHAAELRRIGRAEPCNGCLVQQNLAGRHKVDMLELTDRALAFGIEGPDRFERIAEEVEADGRAAPGA